MILGFLTDSGRGLAIAMDFGLRPWLDGLCFLTDSGRGLASYGLWVKALVG